MKRWFKSKFNEIGEKAVDSMVNLILSKNTSNINFSSQNPIISAITKSVNSKFTIKQSNTKLLDENLDRYPSICDFNLFVSEGIFLLVSDGSMAHTKYFSNLNITTSNNNTTSNFDSKMTNGGETDQPSKQGINSIRHTMMVDEKQNKIEFDTVGTVKPNFCKYKIVIEMNNKSYSSDKKNMYEDFNRVIFDYSFTGKVYNINTDVIISVWCQLDLNKYTENPPEEAALKKPLQPRKISSVQCPSIYVPKVSHTPNRSTNGSSIPEDSSFYDETIFSQYSSSNTTVEENLDPTKNPSNTKEESDSNKKEKDSASDSNDKNNLDNFDLDELLSVEEEEPQHKPNETNYTRKIGRAIISVPLLLSSFKPEGSLNVHEDLKFLLKYSRQVLSINFKNHENTGSNNKDHTDKAHTNIDATTSKTRYHDGKKNRYTIRSCFWLQLLPFNENDDFKFLRPYCGYPCYGMRNPVDSIGFLLVTVEVSFNVNPSLLPILNNLVPHNHCWTMAKDFEMFHLSQVADRFMVYFTNIPIWITRLLFGGTHYLYNHNYIDNYIEKKLRKLREKKLANQQNKKKTKKHKNADNNKTNTSTKEEKPKDDSSHSNDDDSQLYQVEICELDGVDLLFIVPFWFLIFELVVNSRLWQIPLLLFLMIMLIMLYYKIVLNRFTAFGDRISSMRSLQQHGLIGDYIGVGRVKYRSCSILSHHDSLLHNLDRLTSSTASSTSSSPLSTSITSSRKHSTNESLSSSKSNTPSTNTHRNATEQESENTYVSPKDDLNETDITRLTSAAALTTLSDSEQNLNDTVNLPSNRSESSTTRRVNKEDANDHGSTHDNHDHTANLAAKMLELERLRKEKYERRKTRQENLERERLDKFNNSLIENHLYRKFNLINRFGVKANDSVVITPLGKYKLNFLGLGEEYPIFVEDLGDFDIKELIKSMLVSLKYLQQILGYVCLFIEKIRFSLDTGYHSTTVLTILILSITLVPLSLFLKLLCKISFRNARFLLFLYILKWCMRSHIKQMTSDVKCFISSYFKTNSNSESTNFIIHKIVLNWLKRRLVLVLDFFKNWYLGLPDHREVDHRKICALQNLPTLCHMLPKEYEVDWRYFRRQFKNHYKLLGSNLTNNDSDLNTYAKCKSLIERTVLEEYFSSTIPRDLSED